MKTRNYVYRISHPNDGLPLLLSLQVYTHHRAALALCLPVSKTLNIGTRPAVVGLSPPSSVTLPFVSDNKT